MAGLVMDVGRRAYFELHAALDKAPARGGLAAIIRPAVEEDPSRAPHSAEGALIRLLCGERCFDRYQRELAA